MTSFTSEPGRKFHGAAAAVPALLAAAPAHAYVDPGSAGFVVTTVLGFLGACVYVARSWIRDAARWALRRGKAPGAAGEAAKGARDGGGDSEAES